MTHCKQELGYDEIKVRLPPPRKFKRKTTEDALRVWNQQHGADNQLGDDEEVDNESLDQQAPIFGDDSVTADSVPASGEQNDANNNRASVATEENTNAEDKETEANQGENKDEDDNEAEEKEADANQGENKEEDDNEEETNQQPPPVPSTPPPRKRFPPHPFTLIGGRARWRCMWTIRATPDELKKLHPLQKTNFIPGIHEICRKDKLHSRLVEFQKRWPEHYTFWPRGYLMADEHELAQFRALYESDAEQEEAPIFIVKRPLSSCGRGVFLVNSKETLDVLFEEDSPILPLDKQFPLAQEYIGDVQLFDGFKFTMRVYVAITCFNPLCVYVFDNGLLRICSKKYSCTKESLGDIFVHIDSIDLNISKEKQFASQVDKSLGSEGLRCDIKTYLEHITNGTTVSNPTNRSAEDVWKDIKDVVAKSMICGEEAVTAVVSSRIKQRSHVYELLGYDILLDSNLKPWLLEINHTPSLSPITNIENKVKGKLLLDLFKLVDCMSVEKPVLARTVREFFPIIQQYDLKVFVVLLTAASANANGISLFENFDTTDLTIQQLWVIVDKEMEFDRRNGFERVLPDQNLLPIMMQNNNVVICQWLASGLRLKDMREILENYKSAHMDS